MKKEADTVKDVYSASTHDTLLVFTSLGRCYWLKVWQIPEGSRRSKGKPLINLLEDIRPEEKIATIFEVSRSSHSEVHGNEVVSDGRTVKDLSVINVETMQKYLESKETNFANLLEKTINKIANGQ